MILKAAKELFLVSLLYLKKVILKDDEYIYISYCVFIFAIGHLVRRSQVSFWLFLH